jgi:hypothetical protein
MYGKGVEESSCGLIWGAFDWRDCEKPHKFSLMVPIRLWSWGLNMAHQECETGVQTLCMAFSLCVSLTKFYCKWTCHLLLYTLEYFPVDNTRIIYRKIFQCILRMFIFFTNFDLFCIDNVCIIYQKYGN